MSIHYELCETDLDTNYEVDYSAAQNPNPAALLSGIAAFNLSTTPSLLFI